MDPKIVLLVSVLALPLAMKAAGDAPLDRATLRGVGSVGVIVDPIAPDLAKEGLTQDILQKRIEARLHDAGIVVDPSAREFVGIRLLHVRGQKGAFGQGPYALSLAVGVYQSVQLVRNKDLRTSTETWGVETILMADPKILNRETMNSVDELADRLVAAYRSANPK
jgi:hypothetical protein